MIVDLTSLTFTSQNFRLRSTNQSAGVGQDGREQVVATESRVWDCEIDLKTLTKDDARQLSSYGDELNGRAGIVLLPVCNPGVLKLTADVDQFYLDAGYSQAEVSAGFEQFSDGTSFTDGTGFALPSTAQSTASKSEEVGSSSVVSDGLFVRMLKPGQFFEHQNFLYRVAEVVNGAVRFNPPLRAAVTAGDVLEVSNPVVKMRLADDDGWSQVIRLHRITSGMSLQLTEAFRR